MNKKIAAALLTLALLVPLAGHAQGVYRSNNTSNVISSERVYLGVKYGEVSLEVDSDDGDREKAADNLGVVFGGDINDYLALEFEYTKTVSTEVVEVDVISGGVVSTQNNEFRIDTLGIFLVAKSTGNLYGKARVGYSWIQQDFDIFGSDTVYGIAYGVGAGYKVTDTFLIEGEYTMYPESNETDRFGDAFGNDVLTDIVSVNLIWSYN